MSGNESVSNKTTSAIQASAENSVLAYQSMADTVHTMLYTFWRHVPYLVLGLAAFLLFWIFSHYYKHIIHHLLSARLAKRQNLLIVFKRLGSAFILFIGFIIAMMIAIPGFTAAQVVSGLGIGSVAIGFAFKDIFQNLLSGILLLLSEPFQIGDRIISGSFEGTVEDIEIRATTLKTYDGRTIVIPNAQLYTTPVTVNTCHGQHRLSVNFVVASKGIDIEALKANILAKLKQDCSEYVHAPEAAIIDINAEDITLEIRWWTSDHTDNNQMYDRVLSTIQNLLTQSGVSDSK